MQRANTAQQTFVEGAGRGTVLDQTHGQVLKLRMHSGAKNESLFWRPWLRAVLGIALALLALSLLALGQQQNATEDQVKAAYLFNFAKLAE